MRVIAWTHRLGADLGPRCRRGGGERRRAPASGKAQAQPRVAGGLAPCSRRSSSACPEGLCAPRGCPDASVGRPWPWRASWGRLEACVGRGPTAHGHSLPSSGTRARREDLLAMCLPIGVGTPLRVCPFGDSVRPCAEPGRWPHGSAPPPRGLGQGPYASLATPGQGRPAGPGLWRGHSHLRHGVPRVPGKRDTAVASARASAPRWPPTRGCRSGRRGHPRRADGCCPSIACMDMNAR
jgi:hypothetical protein